jgi:hypothetical protein
MAKVPSKQLPEHDPLDTDGPEFRAYLEGMRQLLADMDEEFGPIPDDVKERVDREWDEIERWFDEYDRSS